MTINVFIEEVLAKNFGPDDEVKVGLNYKFTNEKDPKKRFARDFVETSISLKALKKYLGSQRKKAELYICPTPIKGKKRLKENAQETYLVFMDIDGARVPEKYFKPSYVWETSPKKYQGVWILDNPLTPDEHEKVARTLVQKYGFDKTSSDIVHYYRVPQTVNHKYKSDFNITGLQGEGTVFRKSEFIKRLKKFFKQAKTAVAETGEIKKRRFDLNELLDRYDLASVFDNKVVGTDRSEYCFLIEQKMINAGARKEEVYFVLLNSDIAMSKYKTEKALQKEIHRVFAKLEPDKRPSDRMSSFGKVHTGGVTKANNEKVKILALKDIEEWDGKDFWLIEGLWANHSVGIIGAPSKSFKSTLTLNMAVSVATGRDFDGHKVKQGGVLIVQGENNPSMEKAKLKTMAGTEDLPIYYTEAPVFLDRIHHLKSFVKKNDIKLLILDPMYLLFGSGDINKHQDVADRLRAVSEFRDETGCSVIIVHHTRKIERGGKVGTSDLYGSTFIEGWYESMITLQRKGATTSKMTTYFRNFRSGDVYILQVDDPRGAKLQYLSDEEADFGQLIKKGPDK